MFIGAVGFVFGLAFLLLVKEAPRGRFDPNKKIFK